MSDKVDQKKATHAAHTIHRPGQKAETLCAPLLD